ncbi:MAG: hypothetical protein KAJ19_23675 [Gammaproteobacteria bacterium]|nr:hypothetical protein [Gammaproteobacteria bacterium]
MTDSKIRGSLRSELLSMKLAFLKDSLAIVEEHNEWMRTTPHEEVKRIFKQYGEPVPTLIDPADLKRRIVELTRSRPNLNFPSRP